MKQFNKIWFLWLILVIIWNYGWPNADPIYDVIIAVALSVLTFKLKNII
jgi:hypothetical protein|tara:strand:- start:164 stop:310 length:147 start_codon:yes stop_codon:yes gene_type:complete